MRQPVVWLSWCTELRKRLVAYKKDKLNYIFYKKAAVAKVPNKKLTMGYYQTTTDTDVTFNVSVD